MQERVPPSTEHCVRDTPLLWQAARRVARQPWLSSREFLGSRDTKTLRHGPERLQPDRSSSSPPAPFRALRVAILLMRGQRRKRMTLSWGPPVVCNTHVQ